MHVVNPNNTSHNITLIPRFYPIGNIEFYLYNESTPVETNPDIIYILENGYLSFTFDATFENESKYQYKLTQGNSIVYRGKLIATQQNTQGYLTDDNQFYYE